MFSGGFTKPKFKPSKHGNNTHRSLVPQSSSSNALHRPVSDEFHHDLDNQYNASSLPNLDSLTAEDINIQFESMLVSRVLSLKS